MNDDFRIRILRMSGTMIRGAGVSGGFSNSKRRLLKMHMSRREFVSGAAALVALPPLSAFAEGTNCVPSAFGPIRRSEEQQSELISEWNAATQAVSPQAYAQYLRDGDTHGYKALEALERAFEKVMREAKETTVTGDVPAVWSVYNMGYIVKTRQSLFSIDLVHRRDAEFASLLDFALITHNHGDHWRGGFYNAMNGSGKTVVSNFLDNYGVKNWKKDGGYVRCSPLRANGGRGDRTLERFTIVSDSVGSVLWCR